MFRSLAVLSAVGLVALATNARAADDQPKDIILRAIKAHGGEELLTKYKGGTTKGKGKMDLPGVGEVDFSQETTHMLPDKLKESVELTVMGQTVSIITFVNGDKYSVTANGTEVPLDDSAKDTLKNVGNMLKMSKLVSLVKEQGYELSLIGEDKVDDKPVIGIRVVSKGAKDISLFFDKKTNLLTKLEYRTISPLTKKEINEERIIQEYSKNKEGMFVPKKVVVKHDGKKFLEIEISEVQFFEKIDESEFKK
jgi:hypothetical protein